MKKLLLAAVAAATTVGALGAVSTASAQPYGYYGPPRGWAGPHYYWRGHHYHNRAWAYGPGHRRYWRYY